MLRKKERHEKLTMGQEIRQLEDGLQSQWTISVVLNTVSEPAASALPRSFIDMQILSLHATERNQNL